MHVADRIRAFAQLLVEVGVLGEARLVDHVLRRSDIVALDVDLDEVRRGHFIVEQPEGVDEKDIFLPRNGNRNVIVDTLAPAEMIENAIAGCQVLSRLPFGVAAFEIAGLHLGGHGSISP